jgi:hypothetical protein
MLAAGMKISVLLLCNSPLGTLDGALWVKGRGREFVAQNVEGGEDRLGDGRISVGAAEVPSELLEGTLPDRDHLESRATSDMLGGLVGARASKALGRVPGLDQRACGDPSMQLLKNGTEGAITAELSTLAGIGSKSC